jgi:NAD(P)-dependent dehydrogenase (short-subunit alcohol dehydrogenase family)
MAESGGQATRGIEGSADGAVLVTGAAARIGRAIALDLGRRGWAVAIHYHRSAEGAAEVAADLTARGSACVTLAGDLGREEDRRSLVGRATAALGPLTCLINNASIFEYDNAASATEESWRRHIDTNAWAPLALTQQFAAQLPDGARGNVVNLLDQSVLNLSAGFTSYTASKSALWTLTQTLALALAPHIRVNGIGPGPALASARQSDSDFAAQSAATPLGRGTSPDEICAAVRFILGAPAMTGQMIALDGGQHLVAPSPRVGEQAR